MTDLLANLIAERNQGMPRWKLTPAPETGTPYGYYPPATLDPPTSMRLVHDSVEMPDEAPPLSRTAYVIGEVEHLLRSDTAASIARRLGYARPASLARVLDRADRHDLARHFRSAAA